jgi:hypothetical protein
MLRIPHCLDNRLTDCGKVVTLTRRPPSTPKKHFLVLISDRGCQPQGHSVAGRITLIEKRQFNDLIGTRSHDLPVCSMCHN